MAAGEQERARFPHLLEGEVRVWRKFLQQYERMWDTFEYDVHVGQGSLPQDDPANVFQQNYQWITKKRIDVVGWKDKQATIFEVRARASLPLMGQLLGYKSLWMRENPTAKPPLLMMICSECPPDDKSVMDDQGVDVVAVGYDA
jgi:hypothetical protein